MFAEIHSSKRALDIITRFEAVSPRAALREALHKCMLTAFSRYSLELDEIQNTYEKHKVHLYISLEVRVTVYKNIYSESQGSPPLSKNAPPIAGAVSWSRQLLRRVEEPMEVFRKDQDIMESVVSD